MQSKRPTRQQKIFLKVRGLNPENWLILSDDQYRMIAMHRSSLKHKTLVKEDGHG